MKMKGIMARHGIPEQVFSDNGPQFSCAEFAQFANTWGFVHSTSIPRYPQSNGLAEKDVQTVKRIVMKATASGRDPYIALLEYRTTPISDCGKSPAQLLMIEIYSTFNTGLATTCPRESRGYSNALRREAR